MKSYDLDYLVALNKALVNIGMASNRRRLFLESWINARNIRISKELAQELDLIEQRSYDWRRTFHYGGDEEEEKPSKLSEMGTFLTGLANFVSKLQPQPQPSSNDNSQVIAELTKQINELREKLEEEKLEQLRKEVEELKSKKSDALTQAIVEVGEFLKGYTSIIAQALNVSISTATPPKEKVGEPSYFNEIPPEYLE
jgi:DNA-binding transcriptional MerR regulator